MLAWLAAMGTLCWLAVSVAFGVIVNNLTDLRVVVFAILSVGLIIFSVKDALAKGRIAAVCEFSRWSLSSDL